MLSRRLAFLRRGFGQDMTTNGVVVLPKTALSLAARFSTNPPLYGDKPVVAESEVVVGAEKVADAATTTTEKGSAGSQAHRDLQPRQIPSALTKQVLVMMGSYKSTAEVPNEIPYGLYTKARTWLRIRFGTFTMIVTLLSSYIVIQGGKKNVEEWRAIENVRHQQEMDEKYDVAQRK